MQKNPVVVLPLVISVMIVAVAILFAYSLFNPVEKSLQQQDENLLRIGQCFKPVSQYYKSDPRAIFDAHGNINFSGYLCARR